jgi:seryl-tRNA synthetase
MESVSTRLDDETARLIRETADERGVSMAEVLRDLVEKGMEYDDREAELQERIEELETERDRLQRQLAAVNSRQEDVTELVEYVEEQRELTRYQERRQRQLDRANILTRWKWKLTGVPVENSED